MRRLANISQIITGVPIGVTSGAALVYAIVGLGADARSRLLENTATVLLAIAIYASPGRGSATAAAAVTDATAIAVPVLLVMTKPFLVEMLLQLHVAQPPIHHFDQILMYSLIVLLHRH